MTKDRVILGIDPGTIVMGYGVLTIEGNKPKLEAMGILQLNKYEDHYLRLRKIFERVLGLIDQYHPDELAIEAPFFGKNVQSMLKLGRAQGVAMAAALERDIPIFEYAPLKIKMSITGNGNAAKEQVAGMLQRYLHIPEASMLPSIIFLQKSLPFSRDTGERSSLNSIPSSRTSNNSSSAAGI